ncbi:MauE/DoxX family redox-associated membrane protein [Aquipuribacter sp. MA13-6]|uniref:MauE/DoxX family redox-associated membrane protein n=1 Tax=unclassified Aquipuribacter TaxID=2635084 RepID=UPI003EEB772D
MTVLALLARLSLAGVLLVSGTIKLLDPDGSVRAVRAYRLLPDDLSVVVGYGLPALEVGLGILLLLGLSTRLAAVGAGLLVLAFVAGIASAWARGLSIDCGCFGGGGDVAPGTASYAVPLARDVGLLLAAVLLSLRPRTPLSLDNRLDER